MRKIAAVGWIQHHARMVIAVVAVGSICALLVINQLHSLLPGANTYEAASLDRLARLGFPWTQPLDYPFFLVAKIFDVVVSPLLALRLSASVFGLATAALLCYTLRQWFNNRIAVAGTLFIVTSSWFLHMSRIGAPFIVSAFWLSLLIAIGTYRTYTTKPFITDCVITAACALSLYSPYFMWFALIGFVVLAIRRKKQLFVLPRKHQWSLPLIAFVVAAPLLYAVIRDIDVIKVLLGINRIPGDTVAYFTNITNNVSQIFFRGIADPALNLGRLPLLDIFSVVMCGIGMYYFERRLHLRRSQLIFASLVVILAAISLAPFNISKLAILFPIIMLLCIGGIVELLERWLKGFPHNPIARSVGVCVMVVAIGFTSFYHMQRYFVAWASSPNTVEAHKK